MGQKKRVFCGYINIKRNDREKAGDDELIQFTLNISWHEYRQNEKLKVFDVTKRKLFPPVFYSFYNNRDIREAIVPRWKCLYKNNIFCCAMFRITSINMASVATHNDTLWHYIACDMMCFFFQTHSKGFQIFSKVVQNQSILHCVRGGGNLIPSVI